MSIYSGFVHSFMFFFAFNAFHTLLVMAVVRVAGEKKALASRGSTGPPLDARLGVPWLRGAALRVP